MPDDVSNIARKLGDEQPQPSEHAINAENEKVKAERQSWAELKDNQGQSFDATIHQTNSDGSPKLSPKGNLLRRPGRKPGGQASGAGPRPKSFVAAPGAPSGGPGPGADPTMQSRAVAVATVQGIQSLGMLVGGDEWQFRKIPDIGLDEQAQGIEAFAAYFEANEIRDIPPGIGIAIWAAGYTIPRLFAPKTKSRLSRAWDWLKVKLGYGTLSDSGDDGKRENNLSDKVSGGIQATGNRGNNS